MGIRSKLFSMLTDAKLNRLIKRGMKVGKNFACLNQVILDPSHCWLIEIGDNVTMAPRVHVLCHDASTKKFLDCTKIGRVTIGNNVFIGASSIIMPGVTIGNNVVIGANSTVTHDVPDNSVCAGSPARRISSLEDYLAKEKRKMEENPCYGYEYTLNGGITPELKLRQKEELKGRTGFVK